MLELAEPSKEYEKSFIEAAHEFANEGSPEGSEAISDFDAYISNLRAESEGKSLKPNYVPASTFWLIDDGSYIGRVNIRHSLNKTLEKVGGHIGYAIRPTKRKQGYGRAALEMALPQAKKIGLSRVLITCDEDNMGSRKIIESSGGRLRDTVSEKQGKLTRRYWIVLD